MTEISDFLFDHGVASSSIAALLNEIGELTRIAKRYQRSSKPSLEHETVAYLVVPLLRALGWTPQRMAVEWNYLDLALFTERCLGPMATCAWLSRQRRWTMLVLPPWSRRKKIRRETSGLPTTHCDGRDAVRCLRPSGNRVSRLYAYLNLTRLRRDYAILGCKGSEDALLAMAPEWGTPNETNTYLCSPQQ